MRQVILTRTPMLGEYGPYEVCVGKDSVERVQLKGVTGFTYVPFDVLNNLGFSVKEIKQEKQDHNELVDVLEDFFANAKLLCEVIRKEFDK